MAIPLWPSTLPTKPVKDSYSEMYPNNILSFSGDDSGAAKRRAKMGLTPYKIKLTYFMDEIQYQTFFEFVEDTLKKGTLRYQLTHPRTCDPIEVRVVPSGDGLYNAVTKGYGYSVSFQIEVLP